MKSSLAVFPFLAAAVSMRAAPPISFEPGIPPAGDRDSALVADLGAGTTQP